MTTPTPAPQQAEGERERPGFEAFMLSRCVMPGTLERFGSSYTFLDQAWHAWLARAALSSPQPTAAVPAEAPSAETTCNCRWVGDKQVKQCTLHEAHVDAIHDWAARAKDAEKKLETLVGTPRQLPQGGDPVQWRALSDAMPEPEVFVLTWDGKRVDVDWWGSLRYRRDDGTTHWCPFPKPPGAGRMYGMHSIAEAAQAPSEPVRRPLTEGQINALIQAQPAWREIVKDTGWIINGELHDFARAIELALIGGEA